MNELNENGRMRWKCRRGMLELDVILLNFFDHHYNELPGESKQVFEQLLEEEDPVLYSWLMGYKSPEDQVLRLMVNTIRNAMRD